MAAAEFTIDRLERWVLFGGHWRLAEVSTERAVVDLCACTGEVVERVECCDTAIVEFLRSTTYDHG